MDKEKTSKYLAELQLWLKKLRFCFFLYENYGSSLKSPFEFVLNFLVLVNYLISE
jgi:hypothetical protein